MVKITLYNIGVVKEVFLLLFLMLLLSQFVLSVKARYMSGEKSTDASYTPPTGKGI